MLIPFILFSVLFFIIGFRYQKNYTELLWSTYRNEIQIFSQENEEKLKNITLEAKNLDTSPYFYEAMTSDADEEHMLQAVNILNDFVISHRLIHSAVIINRSNKIVTTNSGTYSLDKYFNDFDMYTPDYWYDYESIYNTVQTLPPQQWHSKDSNEAVITLIISPWNAEFAKNLFVINISAKETLNNINNYVLTKNTCFFLLNRHDMSFIAPDSYDHDVYTYINNNFTRKSFEKNNYMGDAQIDGKKYLIMSSAQTKSSWYHSYIAAIPYNDIYNKFPPYSLYLLFSGIVLCFLMLLYFYIEAKIIYKPIAHLETLVKKHMNNMEHNGFEFDSIEKMVDKSFSIQDDYNSALSLLKEKYLTEILIDENTSMFPLNSQDDFFKSKISFAAPYFTVVAFKLFFDKSTLDTLGASPTLLDDITTILRTLFARCFDTYIIKEHKVNPIIYMVLNSSSANCTDELINIINEFEKLFEADRKHLTIYHSMGETYEGYENIALSFNEAKSILYTELKKQEPVSNLKHNYAEFTLSDEQLLTNYLISGHIDKAKTFTLEYIKQFTPDFPAAVKNRSMTIILSAIFKVMHSKHIPYNTHQDKSEADIIVHALRMPMDKLEEYLSELFASIEAHFQTYNSKLDMAEVIEYISHNYSSDLSLNSLAEKFQTNSSYISRRIKQYLDMTFSNYLAKIRIDKAKELLATTNMSVTQIYTSVGFYSRATFIRTFNKIVGLSPTEYREANK